MEKINEYGIGTKLLLGFQHMLAMFGATVLVPILTGLSIPVTLFAAGVGTLIFHLVTKRKVPVFLGSSFAFLGVIFVVSEMYSGDLAYATGGIFVAGLVYLVLAVLVYLLGAEKIKALLPPVVTGPIIMVIGLKLVPVGISGASTNWLLAAVAIVTIIVVSIFFKGFFKLVPILFGLLVSYIVAVAMGLVDFSAISQTNWVQVPDFMLPKFSWAAVLTVAPIAFVTFMEHIGDVTTNGAVVGEDFIEDPGLHRTLLGDGLATAFAGLIGAPANTTYSENTGVLAITKMYSPVVIRIAAIFAIILAFIGKFSGFLNTVPPAIIGGIGMVLYGMIASVGLRSLSEAKLDFSHSRNLIIVTLILVIGLGIEIAGTAMPASAVIIIVVALLLAGFVWSIISKVVADNKKANIITGVIAIAIAIIAAVLIALGAFNELLGNANVVSGLFLAAVVGVVLNIILPKDV
jgi:uracil permease